MRIASKILYWLFLFSLAPTFILNQTPASKIISGSQNTWETFSLPFISGGVITQIITSPIDSNHLFALQEQTDERQTILESNDAGDHWRPLANLQHLWIRHLLIDPIYTNILYMGGDKGIFRSENNGTDWIKVANYGPQLAISKDTTLYSFEYLPGTPECPIGKSAFVRSHDRGITWEKVSLPCGFYGEISIWQSNPRILYLRGSDPQPNGSQILLHSTDGGDTWSFLPLTGPLFMRGIFTVIVDPENPEKLYSSSGTGIIISIDGGKTWQLKLDTSIPGSFIFSFANNEIYAGFTSALVGTSGSVFHSSDSGESWTQLPVQPLANPILLLSNSSLPDLIYISLEGYGIQRSIDGGQTWQNINVGVISTTKIDRLKISPDPSHQIFALITWPRRALFKSIDGGLSWSQPLSEIELSDITSDPRDENLIWGIGPNGWVESKNGGMSWEAVSPLSGSNLTISPAEPDRPCTTHNDQTVGYLVCRRLDPFGNETWESTQIPGSKALSQVVMSSRNKALLFVAGTSDYQVSTIYRSEDDGKTWKEVFQGPPDYLLFDLAVSSNDPAKVVAVFGQYHPDNLLVYESIDTGNNWRDLTYEMQVVAGNLWTKFVHRAFLFIDSSDVIYFASGDTILAQVNLHQTWQSYGPLEDKIFSADIETGSPGSLWLAGEKSGWKLPLLLRFSCWVPIIYR